VSISQTDAWKHALGQISRQLSGSVWRLPLLGFGLLTLYLGTFYLIRGMRGVMLAAAMMIGAAGFAVCFAHPFPTLLGVLFLSFSSLDWILPGPVTLGLLTIVLARVLFDLLGNRRLDLGTAGFRAALVILLAICLTSLLFARRLDYAYVEVELLIQGVIYLVCISHLVDRPSRVLLLIKAVILGFTVAILLASKELVVSGGLALLGTRYVPRIGTGGWDANVGAMISVCLIPFVAFIISRERRYTRLLWFIISILLSAAVVTSASRMGMGVLGVVVLLLTFQFRRLALLAVAAVIFLVAFLPQEYWVRFISLGQLGGIVVDRSLQLRQHALEAAWELFRAHPWTGIGLGNVSVETGRYMSFPKVAHNTYVGTLASLGIFGFLAYVWWFSSGVQMALRAWRLAKLEQRDDERTFTLMILLSMLALLMTFTALDLAFHLMVWLLLALANVMRQILENGVTWDAKPSPRDN